MATRLNRERIGLIGRWLAMALLVAQFGAEVHLYSHPLSDSSEKLGAARTCGTCLASSQLQNAVAVRRTRRARAFHCLGRRRSGGRRSRNAFLALPGFPLPRTACLRLKSIDSGPWRGRRSVFQTR